MENLPPPAYNGLSVSQRMGEIFMEQGRRERQIWQRVLSTQEETEDLKTLAFWAQEDEAAFRLLAERMSGKQREKAQWLLETARRKKACLDGIEMLAGGRAETCKPLPPPREPPRRVLEKSYRRALRSVAGFTARIADRQFGPVFRHLAAQEEARCAAIAELLGMSAPA